MHFIDPTITPGSSPDERETYSLRYGKKAFMVVPLSSGRIAVLGYARAVHAICENFEEAIIAAESIDYKQRPARSRPAHIPIAIADIDLDL
jgi:hypothetical protein